MGIWVVKSRVSFIFTLKLVTAFLCMWCACGVGILRGHLWSQLHLYMGSKSGAQASGLVWQASLPPNPSHPVTPLSYPLARAECLSTLLLLRDDQLSLARPILMDKAKSVRSEQDTLYRQADAILASLVPVP